MVHQGRLRSLGVPWIVEVKLVLLRIGNNKQNVSNVVVIFKTLLTGPAVAHCRLHITLCRGPIRICIVAKPVVTL